MIAPCLFGACISIAGLICLGLGIVNTETQLWIPGIIFTVMGMISVVVILRYSYTVQTTEHVNPVIKKNKSDTNLELMSVEPPAADDSSI